MASITVDWGDGSAVQTISHADVNTDQSNISLGEHEYPAAGTYTVIVTWTQGVYSQTAATLAHVLESIPITLSAREGPSSYLFPGN